MRFKTLSSQQILNKTRSHRENVHGTRMSPLLQTGRKHNTDTHPDKASDQIPNQSKINKQRNLWPTYGAGYKLMHLSPKGLKVGDESTSRKNRNKFWHHTAVRKWKLFVNLKRQVFSYKSIFNCNTGRKCKNSTSDGKDFYYKLS